MWGDPLGLQVRAPSGRFPPPLPLRVGRFPRPFPLVSLCLSGSPCHPRPSVVAAVSVPLSVLVLLWLARRPPGGFPLPPFPYPRGSLRERSHAVFAVGVGEESWGEGPSPLEAHLPYRNADLGVPFSASAGMGNPGATYLPPSPSREPARRPQTSDFNAKAE